MALLNIPRSDSTVRVRAIDTTTCMSLHTDRFIEPNVPGFETLNLTSVCFLIEHAELNKNILFDCGARKDFENYPPAAKARLNSIIKGLRIDKDVNDILVEAGIDLNTIDAIVWSHWHWDHIGAAEKFPSTAQVVVGPGFVDSFIPGYPTNPDAPLLEVSFTDRKVHEVTFDESQLKLGRFDAYDYFGDGSFYLLNSPGHAIGHMCGLARTTSATFVFLGGDICHFPGVYRPTNQIPLPDVIPTDQLDEAFAAPCPCSLFTAQHPLVDPATSAVCTTPFFNVTSTTPSSYLDRETAMKSIRAMQEFDASPDVLVCIAHDPTLVKMLPLLNSHPEEDLNEWKVRGYKERLLWGWLNELPREGRPGRPMLADGTFRNGEKVTDFLKLGSTAG